MIIVLLLGLTVGVILALTGAGGGILAVPLLVFGAGRQYPAENLPGIRRDKQAGGYSCA